MTDNAEVVGAGFAETLSLVVPDDDTAYYYYVTTSDSYNIERSQASLHFPIIRNN